MRWLSQMAWGSVLAGLACSGVVAESASEDPAGTTGQAPIAPRPVPVAVVEDATEASPVLAEAVSAQALAEGEGEGEVEADAEEPSPPVEAVADDATCRTVPDALDVLFIGNSYTDGYDLPGQVERLGARAGIEVHAERLVVHGEDFAHHAARPVTADTIASTDWDVVVLQSHSLDTLRHRQRFLDAGAQLVEMVEDAGAQALVFETWARQDGHDLYHSDPATGGSPTQMLGVVRDAYHELAARTGAEVAPVGEAWAELQDAAPELQLYARDGHHPGRLGAYLSANVIFAEITGLDPQTTEGEPPRGIAPEVADRIEAQAAAIVDPPCSAI